MHSENVITINAPRDRIFDLTTQLHRWPELLPHYRYVDFLERHDDHSIIKMACYRTGIPISWTSRLEVDREKLEMRFHHLKAFTKGMDVVWTYTPVENGAVEVRISHELHATYPAAGLIEKIIGGFFIEHVATKTLRTFKQHLESEASRS